jgi:hypothetical protein
MEGRVGNGRQEQNNSGTVDNKQERRTMKSKGAEGLPAKSQESQAANEEFEPSFSDYERVTGSRAGWDPYDVWKTRVKTSANSIEREADPRR